MYHSNNPNIVEIPDDIDRMESMTFIPGKVPRISVIFVLKDNKTYENPTMLYATNGIEHRIFTPSLTLTETVAQPEPTKDVQPVEPPQVETPQEEEQPKMEGVLKRAKGRRLNSVEDSSD